MKLEQTLSLLAAVTGLGGASSAMAQLANGTPGNLVVNGSMDFADAGGAPLPPGGQFFAGSDPTALTGWTFLDAGFTAEYWVAFQGQTSADGGTYLGVQDLDTFGPRVNGASRRRCPD